MNTSAPQALFFGPATLDVLGHLSTPGALLAGKNPGQTGISLGGGAAISLRAFAALGGHGRLALVTGSDAAGDLIENLAQNEFADVQRLPTADNSRVSLTITGAIEGQEATITARHPLNHSATFAALAPQLAQIPRLVLASLTRHDAPLLRELQQQFSGELWLALTADQCQAPETVELLPACRLVQMNLAELTTLTGQADDGTGRPGINWLRDRGVKNVVVTLGANGATAFVDGTWCYRPAIRTTAARSNNQCDDICFGTILYALGKGQSLPTALEAAMAAATLHRANIPFRSWESLVSFAAAASPAPFLRPQPARTYAAAGPFKRLAAAVAALLAYGTALAMVRLP